MAALENGIAAVSTASGQAAQFMAIATIVCAFTPRWNEVLFIPFFTRPVQETISSRG